ncbi:MAG: N-acetyltransferase [Bacteroidales bacterium]|nr:N-acetyltransferase [Bacteroidales bacterium]
MENRFHKLSDVQSTNIGMGTRVWQFAIILKDAKIGMNCNICAHTFIENDVVIGDNVTVKCGVYIWDGIQIENNVQLGPNVTFTNDKYPRAKKAFELKRTLIKENASIGAGAVILCGIEIGENAMIGAGAVVTKDIPPYTLWVGNPAKHKGFVTKEGVVLSLDKRDKDGNQYKIINGELVR